MGIHQEKLFPVDADHITICKIPSAESQHNQAVCLPVAKLIKLAIEPTRLVMKECMFATSTPSVF